MKSKAKKPKTAPSAPKPTVVHVPGDAFFTRRLEIPAEMEANELAGFVALQLEELSPFPLEQLYHGHVRSRDGAAVFLFAAYRRRFTDEQFESWPGAMFVLPDFAPFLRRIYERETVVFLETPTGISALLFAANTELPVRVMCRPLDPNASPEAFDLMRRMLAERLQARTAQQLVWRTGDPPVPRPKGMEFQARGENGEALPATFVETNDCWSMDVRDPAYVAERRKQLGVDVVLWRVVLGAAALLAFLLLGETLLLGGKAYAAWLENRVESRRPLIAELQQKNLIGIQLTDFGLKRANPYEMLGVIASVQPDQVVLSSFRFDQNDSNVVAIKGTADGIVFVNGFRDALSGLRDIAEVDLENVGAQDQLTVFDMMVTFRAPDGDELTAESVAVDAGGGA